MEFPGRAAGSMKKPLHGPVSGIGVKDRRAW
jgi:hypothetical protein